MVQVDADFNSGSNADIFVRYSDPNNAYRVRLSSGQFFNTVYLHKVDRGRRTSLASSTYTGSSVAVKIKVNGISIKVWIDGTLKINTANPHIA